MDEDAHEPSTKPLLVAGRLSHPDFEPSKIKLPNLKEILGMIWIFRHVLNGYHRPQWQAITVGWKIGDMIHLKWKLSVRIAAQNINRLAA
jgi:hypothetical protein